MKISHKILAAFILLAALALPSAVWAQRVSKLPAVMPPAAPEPSASTEERIAAVVNDGIVSTADVRARMALALLTSGLPDTVEVKQRLLPQVLQSLINEQLQLQEGKRLDITVAPEEINQAIKRLGQENRIQGDMETFLTSHGVPVSTMAAQIRAALTWNKVAMRELRPRVTIGDDEIDAAVERLHANAGKQEFLVSEVFLAVDNPKEEEQVKKFAEGLVVEIRNGASFGAIARQFSQGTGAATGGDIGWIQMGQLPPELDRILQNVQAGEVAGPIRTSSGFHILGVRDKRTIALGDVKGMTVDLQQAFKAFTKETDKESLLREADKLRQSIAECDGLPSRLTREYPGWRWQDLGAVKLGEAPKWLADKVRDITVGHASEAMATDKGALILFVCGRRMQENINREEIMNVIGTEKMELLSRRLLRDLRRNAYLDIRLASVREQKAE